MEAPLKKGRYLLPILITAAAITAAGLWFHQNFFRKNAYRSSVELKKLTGKQRVLAAAGFTGIWVLLYLILKQAGAAYVLLDNTVTLFGICISFLQMFAFLEYTYLMIPSGLVTLALSIRMLPEHPEQIAYLIYSIYSLICVTVQLVNARKLYRLQQGGTKEDPHASNL